MQSECTTLPKRKCKDTFYLQNETFTCFNYNGIHGKVLNLAEVRRDAHCNRDMHSRNCRSPWSYIDTTVIYLIQPKTVDQLKKLSGYSNLVYRSCPQPACIPILMIWWINIDTTCQHLNSIHFWFRLESTTYEMIDTGSFDSLNAICSCS